MKNHVLIVSGGVSVGEHDLVKESLRELGAKIEIWRVAVKPGKPFLFGWFESETVDSKGQMPGLHQCFVFGLPGNPVSAFVTFLQFVRPAILRMMGATNHDLRQVRAKLAVGLTNDSDRPHYIRGRLERGKFMPTGRQESHALFGLSQANGFVRVVAGQSLKAEELVDVQIWE
jgi:molybdopterin molybdotransferase